MYGLHASCTFLHVKCTGKHVGTFFNFDKQNSFFQNIETELQRISNTQTQIYICTGCEPRFS